MVLFYVYGSGLGHLNRIFNYINKLKLDSSYCIILTNSKHEIFFTEGIKMVYFPDSIFMNQELFFEKLLQIIDTYRVKEIIVDVFPCGFHGELRELDNIRLKKTLLARILKDSYFEAFKAPFYNEIIVLEKGIMLNNYKCDTVSYVSLKNMVTYCNDTILLKEPFFYIIHSEPEEEVIQLYKLAKLHQKREEHIYIQTYCEMNDFNQLEDVTIITSKHMMLSLLENSNKIFTACGFNTFIETETYRYKQYFIPFKRRYDDQFKRKMMSV